MIGLRKSWLLALPLALTLAAQTTPADAQELEILPPGHRERLPAGTVVRPYSIRLSLGPNMLAFSSLTVLGAEGQIAIGGLSTVRNVGIYFSMTAMEGQSLGGLHARQLRTGVQVLRVFDDRYYAGVGFSPSYIAVDDAGDRPGVTWALGWSAIGVFAADLTSGESTRPFIEVRPELGTTNTFSGETLLFVGGATASFGVHFVEM